MFKPFRAALEEFVITTAAAIYAQHLSTVMCKHVSGHTDVAGENQNLC
jgi:hypothetical protein